MSSRTKTVILAASMAAVAGLVTGCATHPKQCTRCVNGATSDKVSCGSKNGCGGKNGCSTKKGS